MAAVRGAIGHRPGAGVVASLCRTATRRATLGGRPVRSSTGRRYRSRRLFWVPLTLSVVLLAGCGDPDIRDEQGTVVEPGSASVFELQPGDCLDPGAEISGEIAEVPVVPCEDPHTQEVYAAVTHPQDNYPGAEELATFADGACLDELETELGYTLDDGLFFSYVLPTFDGWNTGDDREVLCVLVFPDRDGMTGSFVTGTADFEPTPPAPPEEPDGGGQEQPDDGDGDPVDAASGQSELDLASRHPGIDPAGRGPGPPGPAI